MVFVLRLIAGVALLFFGSIVFAQNQCISGTPVVIEFVNVGDVLPGGKCHEGCYAVGNTDSEGFLVGTCEGTYCYINSTYNGYPCGGNGGDSPPEEPGGSDDNNESGDSGINSGGSGENSSDDLGIPDGDNENDTPDNLDGGNTETPSNNDNNEQTPPGIPKTSGIPDNAVFCGEYSDKGNAYWHDCYDDDGDYWYSDYYESVCDSGEYKREWDECYFDGKYYLDGKKFDSYFDAKKKECLNDYFESTSTYPSDGIEYASARKYCNDLYRDSMEAVLYDAAIADTKGNINVTDKLKGNKTVDIGKRLGIFGGDASSYTSVFPDLLEDSAPDEEGEYGTCLADITITIFDYDIVIPFSIVCIWLEYLGTILVFLSLFVAFSIIRGSPGDDDNKE